MCLGQYSETVAAVLIHNGNKHRQVGGMRAAVIGRIVEKSVPACELRVESLHPFGHQVGTRHDVDRQTFCDCNEFGGSGQYTAGEVAPCVDDTGSRRAQQRILHLSHNAIHSLAKDGKVQAADFHRIGTATHAGS
jgi:hypothetical protein